LLSQADRDLYHDLDVPELVEDSDHDSDDDEMPANADQQGDLPHFEWNHTPGRGVSHEPIEDPRDRLEDHGLRWWMPVHNGGRQDVLNQRSFSILLIFHDDSDAEDSEDHWHLDAGFRLQLRRSLDALSVSRTASHIAVGEMMPELISDSDDDEMPALVADGPSSSRGPCRSPAWGCAKPGRQG
jgi:hypothetical protein